MGRSARPRNIVLQDITIYCLVSKDITIELLSVEGYYLRLLRCRRILPLTVECRRLRNWVILYYFTNFHLHGQFSDQFVIVDLDPMYVYAPDCRSRSNVRIRPRFSLQNILDQKIILIYLNFFCFLVSLEMLGAAVSENAEKTKIFHCTDNYVPKSSKADYFRYKGINLTEKYYLQTSFSFYMYLFILL